MLKSDDKFPKQRSSMAELVAHLLPTQSTQVQSLLGEINSKYLIILLMQCWTLINVCIYCTNSLMIMIIIQLETGTARRC